MTDRPIKKKCLCGKPGCKPVRKTINVNTCYMERAAEIGDTNASHGIRKAVEAYDLSAVESKRESGNV
jgi:hypothetical protein